MKSSTCCVVDHWCLVLWCRSLNPIVVLISLMLSWDPLCCGIDPYFINYFVFISVSISALLCYGVDPWDPALCQSVIVPASCDRSSDPLVRPIFSPWCYTPLAEVKKKIRRPTLFNLPFEVPDHRALCDRVFRITCDSRFVEAHLSDSVGIFRTYQYLVYVRMTRVHFRRGRITSLSWMWFYLAVE